MIGLFETLLRTVLAPAVGGALERIDFLPPDSAWRSLVVADPLLNVYLVELGENRKQRSSTGHGPVRIDCHYLISAWYPKSTTIPPPSTLSSTRQESELLYAAAKRILERDPMVPAQILGNAAAWAPYEDHRIPVTLIPPEGFPKLPEFWGSFGSTDNPWKPVLHLIATLPLDLPQPQPGPPIVKIVLEVFCNGEVAESRITITGTATDAAGAPVNDARLVMSLGATVVGTARSSPTGRFAFAALPPAQYRLEATSGALRGFLDFDPGGTDATYDVQLS